MGRLGRHQLRRLHRHEILARTSDAYRRFRNTLRFLLSELEGQFEPETDGVAFADLLPLDKLMVARLTQVQAEVDDAYSCYEFPRAYRALYDFVVTELSKRVPRRPEGSSVLRQARLA